MTKLIIIPIIFASALTYYFVFGTSPNEIPTIPTPKVEPVPSTNTIEVSEPTLTPSKTANIPLPISKKLEISYHTYQTFNNCGPAALSIALSYYGIQESQQTLGQAIRPYQVANGDNDDKSTTMQELADKATEYGFVTYFRPNGSIELLKKFIANDVPVITKTWLKPNDDIGHFRVVKGYDDNTQQLLQDDSLQGPNLLCSYDEFEEIWSKFGFEYVVLIPKEKEEIAKEIIGESLDVNRAWELAAENARKKVESNPNNTTARFNLSVALYYSKNYEEAVEEFEKVENALPSRTLWYQIEPILAYYELGNYERVFNITDKILNSGNRAFSELYIIRGNIYKKSGDLEQAKTEFNKALLYNKNLAAAQEAADTLN